MRIEGHQKAMLSQAWFTAGWSAAASAGSLPPLHEVLGEEPKVTVGQRMAAILRAKGWTEE